MLNWIPVDDENTIPECNKLYPIKSFGPLGETVLWFGMFHNGEWTVTHDRHRASLDDLDLEFPSDYKITHWSLTV